MEDKEALDDANLESEGKLVVTDGKMTIATMFTLQNDFSVVLILGQRLLS